MPRPWAACCGLVTAAMAPSINELDVATLRSLECLGSCGLEARVRTTLDIDADVLAATKEIAKRQGKSAGKLASELMREALQLRAGHSSPKASGRCGFRPISSGGAPVSNELVNRMRDELGI